MFRIEFCIYSRSVIPCSSVMASSIPSIRLSALSRSCFATARIAYLVAWVLCSAVMVLSPLVGFKFALWIVVLVSFLFLIVCSGFLIFISPFA